MKFAVTKLWPILAETLVVVISATMGWLTNERLYRWLPAFCGILIGLIVVRHLRKPIRKKAACALLEQLHKQLDLPEDDVRCTLLRVNATRKKLKQVERYSLAGEKKSKTTIGIGHGTGGRAWTQNKPCLEIIYGDFEEYMAKLGFTEEQARKFKDRKYYVCVPISSNNDAPRNTVIGVICLDSNSTETFTREGIVEIVESYIPTFRELLKGG